LVGWVSRAGHVLPSSDGCGGLNTASNDRGTVMSGASAPSRWMPAKRGGVTPTMVTIWPLTGTTRPSTAGWPPNRLCQ
jgi:hypothetical protein